MPKKVLSGVVVSNKCANTLTVKVCRSYLHPLYKKIVRRSKKYAVHYEDGSYQVGVNVKIEEHRPISKTKKWIVVAG